jgi:hypothetical protein
MISADVLDRPINGLNLRARTLRGEIGEQTTLLVFLRHFG